MWRPASTKILPPSGGKVPWMRHQVQYQKVFIPLLTSGRARHWRGRQDAKGMGAGRRFMHHQVTRLVVLTLSNLMYCLKATAAKINNLSRNFFLSSVESWAKRSPISSPPRSPVPRWFPFSEHGCSSRASGDEAVLPGQGCCPALRGAAVSNPTLCYGGRCFSFVCEMQSSDDNLGGSNLCTSNMKSQLLAIPLLDTPLAKMGTKDDLKPRRPSGLSSSVQPFPTQREKESQRGRETDNPQHNLLPQNNLFS